MVSLKTLPCFYLTQENISICQRELSIFGRPRDLLFDLIIKLKQLFFKKFARGLLQEFFVLACLVLPRNLK